MRVVKTKLNELRDADVTHVSLVNRSASRIPFRAMKFDQGQSMLDLSNVRSFLGKAKKEDAPVVSAVIVMDQPKPIMDQMIAEMSAAGLVVDKVTKNDDGSVIFAQDDKPLAGAHLVRMPNEMMLAVKGFDAYSDEMRKSGNFSDLMSAHGFFPSLNTAFDALYTKVQSALCDGDDTGDVSSELESDLDDFVTYVSSLIKGLPTQAFKLDNNIALLQEAAKKADAGVQSVASQIPTTPPAGITQNDWDQLDDDGKIAALAKDSTNTVTNPEDTPLKTSATKNAPNVGGNNSTLTPDQLAKAMTTPPTGFTQNDWDALSDDGKKTIIELQQNAAGWQHDDAPAAGPTYKFEKMCRKAESEGDGDDDVDWDKAPKGMKQAAWDKMTASEKKTWASTNDKLGDTDDNLAKKAEADRVAAAARAAKDDVALEDKSDDEMMKMEPPEGMDKDKWGAMKAGDRRAHFKAKKSEFAPILDMLTQLNASMQGLSTTVKAQGETLTAVVAKQETLGATVAESVRKSDDALKKIGATVVGPAVSLDNPTEVPGRMTLDGVQKSDDPILSAGDSVIDTGMMSMTQRRSLTQKRDRERTAALLAQRGR